MRKLMVALTAMFLVMGLGVGAASAAQGGTDRPYMCSGTGTVTLTLGAPIHVHSVATQDCTHLGLSTLTVDGTSTMTVGTLTRVDVAANGDELFAADHTTIVWTSPTVGIVTHTLTYNGGTGRFENASGSATETSTMVLDAAASSPPVYVFDATFTIVGTISY